MNLAADRLSIRHNAPEPVSPYTENDLAIERRLSAAETRLSGHDETLREFREVINKARTQIAFAAAGGSIVGPLIVGVVLWLLTK